MAAPTPTPRQAPAGIRLRNGYRSTITFALDPNIELWEMDVGVTGYAVDDKLDTTTQHNSTRKTFAPPALIEETEYDVTFQYDPALRTAIEAACLREDTITGTYPDGSTYAHYGYAANVEFDPLVLNEVPTGTITIVNTCWDHVNDVEAKGVLASVAGT